ncbi:hypothetical protein GCM10010211_65120 [Streptomyces albospinus]|uniref:Uncharacterized protein n=1 Tax=Streptomyces albospinus TaxID=285515 RepID=A0ABQ2VL20_9ACTN|nr:hypothetical protein GCM10010211_65120 [Streptomyces albospinus]
MDCLPFNLINKKSKPCHILFIIRYKKKKLLILSSLNIFNYFSITGSTAINENTSIS